MQTQDGPAEILFKLWPKLEQNKNNLIMGGVGVIVLLSIGYFITSSRAQKEVDAGQALTSLIITPAQNGAQMASSLQVVAAKYAGTAAAQRATVESAGFLFEAGNYAEAQTQFQKIVDADPTGPFAATAQLGIGACLEAQNKADQAVPVYQRVAASNAGSTCVAPAEFALGRIYEQQNKLPDAMGEYEYVMRDTLESSLRKEAQIRGQELQLKIAASTPKTTVAPKPVVTPSLPGAAPLQPAAKP